ncbi:class II D-tagatose-bisphosphate aldolase, non-catalytic subunit [Paracoccus seriniphilus]|uniref:Tagatose-bisphosphate aldolase noncatalytic subunit n=2 Tax=Paracoccus seriniphilus TaxID=184748 RepID=A0A239Q0J2_9RHOB|nr:class II D-tagatose-bisphosphate aldolase, non-catalytic subunit [Paracoccus seriniphilus]WCR15095.1 class II D-tagatose-bisphosphate aldolase, non-catalytic subunit [Paracoccus seriniphilus]SNT76091.1 tagatose-bisphosphate aldolase noncatalytic subunit [Paracoccus seriniphilus]
MSLVHDLIARNRAGEAIGLPCFCTANEHVLRAVLAYAKKTGLPTVIEATCNQVNQNGGYTGMTASDFMSWLNGMAAEIGVPTSQLILGGDHLGPNPWRSEPVDIAMEKARELVKSYVQAGFRKIHLDASMACGGEPNPSFEQIAERAADLCAVAEAHAPDPSKLIYIIGTEVPIPGGETEEPDALDVTSVDRFHDTISTHRAAFMARGLDAAWERIVSVVTQPGVDFGHSSIYPFVPEKARPLSAAILTENGLTFEAHSTDYQSTQALAELVKAHFFFLKVGPELTFRFRQAVWALASIEDQLDVDQPSRIRDIIDEQMTANPGYWQDYYGGSEAELRLLKTHSYSDRIRYYWADERVSAALDRLIKTLETAPAPETVISQAFMGLEFGEIPRSPQELIETHVQRCVQRYFIAAGHEAT